MLMTRMVLLQISKMPENLEMLNRKYGTVELKTDFDAIWKINNFQELIPIFATTRITTSPLSTDGFWSIPEDTRKLCEKTIERAAAIMAICNGVKQQIHSAFGPSIFFTPETEAEVELLAQSQGYNNEGANIHIISAPPLSSFDWEEVFSDRESGLLLMNEALSHQTSSGRFRDYIRLFENAFCLATKELPKKLSQFLYADFGYSREEIRLWINLRDPLSHADNKKNDSVYYEADIAPYIDRIEQAAYDVMFNKLKWAEKSSERRCVWLPSSYTQNAENKCMIRLGSKSRIHMRDRFNTYPIYLRNNFKPLTSPAIADTPIAHEYSPITCSVAGMTVPLS